MHRISSPHSELASRYEVVVIGSGYGGAIAASRLARAGREVCLLERGKEFTPGSFPDTALEAAGECQIDAPPGHAGSRSGLYDFRVNAEMNVLKGCGLGGTSLINANVAMQPEERVFDDPRWPRELRGRPEELEEGIAHARKMLGSNPYPQDWPALPKLVAHEKSARHMQAPFRRVDINVTFRDGTNEAGVHQPACSLCGDCVSGCNHGSKNTLAMNYLPDAWNFGARIFTQIEVRSLERRGAGWRIAYRALGAGREAFDAPDPFVDADLVIVAGGSLGSTELLLRSAQAGLPLSRRLGEGFSGNGDVLGFGYNADAPIDGVGWGERTREQVQHPDVGPCITSVIDLRHQPELGDGLIIEEGVAPGLARGAMSTTLGLASGLIGRDTDAGLGDELREWARQTLSLVTLGKRGAIRNTQTYLIMAHDGSDGRMELEGDRLRIRWPGVGTRPIFRRADALLEKATEALGGTYVKNPIWSKPLGHDLITVHPLGGCCMGDSAETGVVNHRGQVFRGASGSDVYENLLVCDGAIAPRSLGVNPLLTISALAERSIALLAADRGWTIDRSRRALRSAPAQAASTRVGVQFTETMKGHIAAGARDPQEGDARGRAEGTAFEFTLTARSDDLDAMLRDPEHRAQLTGTATAPVLSAFPLTASEGEFRIFSEDPQRVQTREMRYRMRLHSREGKTFAFQGFKRIHDEAGFDLWSDTTTLFVTIQEQDLPAAPVFQGMLRIALADFVRQIGTMRAVNGASARERLSAIARFGRFFLGELWGVYGKVLAPSRVFSPDAPPRKRRDLRLPEAQIHSVRTGDGVHVRLTRLRGGAKGPVLLAPGMGTSTQAFMLDTLEVSLAEYLTAQGYDLWLLDYRASSALEVSRTQFSMDEIARLDYPAAIEHVRAQSGADSVQVVAHCVASASLFMSLLGGHASGVRSFVASQFVPHVATTPLLQLKAGLRLPALFQALGVDVLSTEFDANAGLADQVEDALLRLYPAQSGQLCNSPTCRRIRFLWGEVFLHENLDQSTHDAVHELFGDGNLTLFQHLAAIVRARKLVSLRGDDVYLPHLKNLALPIAILQGSRNSLFLPEGSQSILDELIRANGAGLYRRHLIEGYAHMDCFIGKRAYADVFPLILRELEAVPA